MVKIENKLEKGGLAWFLIILFCLVVIFLVVVLSIFNWFWHG